MNPARAARAFTFDCYGTLIDWEAGIGKALDEIPSLAAIDRDELLGRREAVELAVEAERFRRYNVVLAISLQRTAAAFGVEVTEPEARRFAASVPDWPPLPDAAPFLRRLRLLNKPMAILSNVTTEGLRYSVHKLGVPFDRLISADDVQAYKPAPQHWLQAQAALGIAPPQQLHIAASMTHDVVPSAQLGVPVVWVNRHEEALPSVMEPALVVSDLHELAEALELPPDPSA